MTLHNGNQRYMVVGLVNTQSVVCAPEARAFLLCRIPDGMTEEDLGRRFRHAPTWGDAARFELIPQAKLDGHAIPAPLSTEERIAQLRGHDHR